MTENLLIFAFSLFLVIKGATLATKYSAKLAQHLNISRYVIGFIVVAFISILPETLISINSAIKGIPEFGLATLFGSNVADLTLIITILIINSGHRLKIESKLLKEVTIYPLFLLLPIIFGLNSHFSRPEGLALILSGAIFYYFIFKDSEIQKVFHNKGDIYKNIFFLLFAMTILLIGAHFTVTSATDLAHSLEINPILIGMLVVGLGTTMPELFYSMKASKENEDDLAVGDILGTVLADATIVVGIIALISPFYFPIKVIYITGAFMVVASVILLSFMKSGHAITKREGSMLFAFWVAYVLIEFFLSK